MYLNRKIMQTTGIIIYILQKHKLQMYFASQGLFFL